MYDRSQDWSPQLPLAPSSVRLGTAGAPGVSAAILDGVGLATVMARKGAAAAVAERIRALYGIEVPTGPRCASIAGRAVVGTGPGAWLMVAEQGGNELAATLAPQLAASAAVADQSDGYFMMRLSGPRVRETLVKLVPIDLHPRSFAVGDAASTVAAHMGVTVWRRPDGPGGSPVFDLVLFRSLARSFWHALAEAAAEFGFAGNPG